VSFIGATRPAVVIDIQHLCYITSIMILVLCSVSLKVIVTTDLWIVVDYKRYFYTAVNPTEHGNSSESAAVPSEEAASVSTDGNNIVSPADRCDDDAVRQMIAEVTAPTPSAVLDTNDTMSATKTTLSPTGSVKRKRGRPPLHPRLAVDRRHQKLVDVCTLAHVVFLIFCEYLSIFLN